jgi:hypothetical protein
VLMDIKYSLKCEARSSCAIVNQYKHCWEVSSLKQSSSGENNTNKVRFQCVPIVGANQN